MPGPDDTQRLGSASKIPVDKFARGNLFGTAIVGAVEHFIGKHGAVAAHDVVSRIPVQWRSWVQPNIACIGLLGAKKYPYPFVGDLFRTMIAVARADEDRFLREHVTAGTDHTIDTVARIVLRLAATPQLVAQRAQQLWSTFHDAGKIDILSMASHEYVAQVSDWPNHDVVVCKICLEARRRVVERTGARNVDVRREKCLAWGHDVCVFRVRWG